MTQDTRTPEVTAAAPARTRRRRVLATCAAPVVLAVLSGLHGAGPLWWVGTVLWLTSLTVVAGGLLTHPRRSIAMGVALLLPAGALAVIGAGTAMGVLGGLGLPLTSSTTRGLGSLALLGAAWLLRAAVPVRSESRGVGGPVVALTIPALAAPALLLLSYPALLGRSSAARLTSMLDGEDAGAWISQAFASLRLGRLPGSSAESGYWNYPPTAAGTGTLAHLTLAAPGVTPGDPVTAAIDAVFVSWILAGVCLGLIALGMTLVALVPTRRGGGALVGYLLGSGVTQLCAYSVVFGLMAIQHLSLAWEGVALAALALVMWAATGVPQGRATATSALVLAGFAAGAVWPFGALSIGAVVALLGLAALQGRRPRRLGGWIPAVGLALGAGAGLLVNLAPVLTSVGPNALLAAGGGTVPVPSDVLLVLGAGGVAVVWASGAALSPPQLRAVLALVAGACLGAVLLYGAQLLPVSTSGYGRDKVTYLAVMTLPMILAVLTAFLAPRLSMTASVGLAAATALLLTSLPLVGGALGWGRALAASPRLGQAERIIAAAQSGLGESRTICLPSARQGQSENYLCQRWVDALSRDQSDDGLRKLWWDAAGETQAAIAAARTAGRLNGAKLVDALWVMAGVPDETLDPMAKP